MPPGLARFRGHGSSHRASRMEFARASRPVGARPPRTAACRGRTPHPAHLLVITRSADTTLCRPEARRTGARARAPAEARAVFADSALSGTCVWWCAKGWSSQPLHRPLLPLYLRGAQPFRPVQLFTPRTGPWRAQTRGARSRRPQVNQTPLRPLACRLRLPREQASLASVASPRPAHPHLLPPSLADKGPALLSLET